MEKFSKIGFLWKSAGRIALAVFDHFIAWPNAAKWGLLVAFFGGFFFHSGLVSHRQNKNKVAQTDTQESQKAIPIGTMLVDKKTIENKFYSHTFLQPKKEIVLHPIANVIVREVAVEVGQKVRKGQKLVLTDSESQALRAKLDKIEMDMKSMDFSVTMALAKKSFLSEKEVKQKNLQFQADQIRRRLAEIEMSGALVSPIDGVVAEISMKPGDFIDNPNQYSVKISDPSTFKVQLYLPQAVARSIAKGSAVELNRNDSSAGQTASTKGSVVAIAPAVDPKSGSILTEIETNFAPKDWIPGMFVEVAITTQRSENVLAVPSQAIVYEKNIPYVFRVASKAEKESRGIASEKTDLAVKVPVKIGKSDAQFTEIESGLQQYEMVIVEGQGNLADGTTVEVVR